VKPDSEAERLGLREGDQVRTVVITCSCFPWLFILQSSF